MCWFSMKEENQPIKLECYLQVTESRREQIGFVLIPLRTIPFWSSRKMGMMKPHWYKLHGVSQDNKTHKPELLLSVTIGDKDEILNDHEKLVKVYQLFIFCCVIKYDLFSVSAKWVWSEG